MDELVSLCKRRGFIFQGSEIYGGMQGAYDYGPLGIELKNNLKNLWWKSMTQLHDNIVGIDAEQKIAIANVISVHRILKSKKNVIFANSQHSNQLTVQTKSFPHPQHISFA